MNVTVLTPTYNRAKLLSKLYDSLEKQENENFEWIVIDDGSTDNTEQFINSIKNTATFSLKYYKKKNGGKHTALNYAYKYITTPLTFIVDSDDWLTCNAISVIEKIYEEFKSEDDLCGFSFLRGKLDGGYLSSSGVPFDGLKENFVECRINREIGGDMAEVWYTHCLKEYPFPEFEDEKFLGEDMVWIQMAKKYKLRFFNKVIYISDYRDDGLTYNRRKHNIASAKGCVARAEVFLKSDANLKVKIKSMLQYQIYSRFAKYSYLKIFHKCNNKMLFCICYIPALCLYLKWNREYNY